MPPYRISSISHYHELRGLPGPVHPLISVVRLEDITQVEAQQPLVQDFYSIAMKQQATAAMRYGQQAYEFGKGKLFFIAPNQVYSIPPNHPVQYTGWLLLLHPDFFWNTSLMQNIKRYDYFSYAVSEALCLSEREETKIVNLLNGIYEESHDNVDRFSKPVLIAQIELLLHYSNRFYHRQFVTREKEHHHLLIRLERLLETYFDDQNLETKGVPTVSDIAQALQVSPSYLSSLLKVLTGKSTQQHLQDKLIEKAKEQLSIDELSISEIAYKMGFEYTQSFSKLFKSKTNQTPTQYRRSFQA